MSINIIAERFSVVWILFVVNQGSLLSAACLYNYQQVYAFCCISSSCARLPLISVFVYVFSNGKIATDVCITISQLIRLYSIFWSCLHLVTNRHTHNSKSTDVQKHQIVLSYFVLKHVKHNVGKMRNNNNFRLSFGSAASNLFSTISIRKCLMVEHFSIPIVESILPNTIFVIQKIMNNGIIYAIMTDIISWNQTKPNQSITSDFPFASSKYLNSFVVNQTKPNLENKNKMENVA